MVRRADGRRARPWLATARHRGGVAVVSGTAPPDRPAIVIGESGVTVTHRELEERSNRLAHLLRAAGLRPGDHLALFMENHPRYFEVAWAALGSGLYVTPINRHLTADEAGYIVRDCGARALVTSHALAAVAAAIDPAILAAIDVRLVIDGDLPGFDRYEESIATQPASPIADPVVGAPMFYSSGTTGRPKGILRPLPDVADWSELPSVDSVRRRYGFRESMTYLSPAPLYHSAPFTYSNHVLALGGTVVVMERFDAARALALIERHRVTHSQWVPTMFVRMLALAERSGHDLSSHECAIHAAAPCPVWVKREMIEWWGPILHEYYAASEGYGSTAIDSHEWLAHPGSVGRALTGTLHIVDEDGRELPPGAEGLVCFSGTAPFEYHNDPDRTAESNLPDGLRTVGDMGYVDADGFLYLTDRRTNMIVSGGVNIYPREIEDVLSGHPAVADVAVVGVPDTEYGEQVKAVVQLVEGHVPSPQLADELIDLARRNLAGYKAPRSVDFDPDLPRTPTGKLLSRVVKARYWGSEGSRIVAEPFAGAPPRQDGGPDQNVDQR